MYTDLSPHRRIASGFGPKLVVTQGNEAGMPDHLVKFGPLPNVEIAL